MHWHRSVCTEMDHVSVYSIMRLRQKNSKIALTTPSPVIQTISPLLCTMLIERHQEKSRKVRLDQIFTQVSTTKEQKKCNVCTYRHEQWLICVVVKHDRIHVYH
jgi:hypothetical protein